MNYLPCKISFHGPPREFRVFLLYLLNLALIHATFVLGLGLNLLTSLIDSLQKREKGP